MSEALQISEKRGKPRVETKVKIKIAGHGATTQTYTGNLSKSGLFIDAPDLEAAIGDKLQLRVTLANAKEPIKVTAKVARLQGPNRVGRSQGMALQFLRVEARQARTFERLIDRLLDARGIGCRKYPRVKTQVIVELKTKEQIRRTISKDIGKGGLFLKTPVDGLVLGDRLNVVILHPHSKRKFSLDAEVVHLRKGTSTVSEDFVEGVGVHFLDVSPARQNDMSIFLRSILAGKKS